ncbi:MAG: hypothetical protein PW999_21350 [Paraburkholderia tropica]|nr:hypothetical protein [Paraburkholderia tropica]
MLGTRAKTFLYKHSISVLSCLNHNRTYVHSTQAGLSDGPWRDVRFKLRRVRRDYYNVIVNANTKTLTRTAEELISNPSVTKHEGFWISYSIRVKQCLHLLSLVDMSVIALSFDMHKTDFGIYADFAAVIPLVLQRERVNGVSSVILADILSRNLRNCSTAIDAISEYISYARSQLSVTDLSVLIHAMVRVNKDALSQNHRVVQLFTKKILFELPNMSASPLINVITTLKNTTGLRSVDALGDRLESRVRVLSNDFDEAMWTQIVEACGYASWNLDGKIIFFNSEDDRALVALKTKFPSMTNNELRNVRLSFKRMIELSDDLELRNQASDLVTELDLALKLCKAEAEHSQKQREKNRAQRKLKRRLTEQRQTEAKDEENEQYAI